MAHEQKRVETIKQTLALYAAGTYGWPVNDTCGRWLIPEEVAP